MLFRSMWLQGQDLNLRPFGYEPNELPGCSTPRHIVHLSKHALFLQVLTRPPRAKEEIDPLLEVTGRLFLRRIVGGRLLLGRVG